MIDQSPQTQPGQHPPTLPSGGGGWKRRYTSARTVVALIALASLIVPGIAAVIAAVVSAW